jgi:hypothetical protein
MRFRQLQVLEDYDACIAICGKMNHIRNYNLTSLKRLICFAFGLDSATVAREDTQVVDQWLLIDHDMGRTEGPAYWVNDYEKMYHTRESQMFVVTRTNTTVYLGVLLAKDIIVFEWAKLPYLRFMKVKEFWLPETPKFFSLLHDGNNARELLVVYEREANRIDFESSKVFDVLLSSDWKDDQPKECVKDKTQLRWWSWTQLFTQGPVNDDKASNKVSWYQTMKNMKPSAVTQPAPPREFLATYGAQSRIVDLEGYHIKRRQGNVDQVNWGQVGGGEYHYLKQSYSR